MIYSLPRFYRKRCPYERFSGRHSWRSTVTLKTSKFAKKCKDFRQSIHFLVNFEVFEWLYLVQYWPNWHETGGFCKARCALSENMGLVLLIPYNPIIHGLIPRLSRYEIRQWSCRSQRKVWKCINQFQQCPFPPGNRGEFAHVFSPGGVEHTQVIAAREQGIGVPRGRHPGIWHLFSKYGRVYRQRRSLCQRLACPSGTRKTCRYFFITCKHINISDKVNYILFITNLSLAWTLRYNCRISHSKLA